MAWVLKIERHYTNGTNATIYHTKSVITSLFVMNSSTLDEKEAKQFRTKKDALDYRRGHGLREYEPVKLQDAV